MVFKIYGWILQLLPNEVLSWEIREDNVVFNDEFYIKNKLPFDNVANVWINFLLWIERLSIENLIKLPHD